MVMPPSPRIFPSFSLPEDNSFFRLFHYHGMLDFSKILREMVSEHKNLSHYPVDFEVDHGVIYFAFRFLARAFFDLFGNT